MRPLSWIETRRDSSAHIALNCFQSIAYVFERNVVKVTWNCVETRSISSLRSQTSKVNLSEIIWFACNY